MTTSPVWKLLPPELADVLEPELAPLSHEIVAAIAEQVPEYARPLEGAFGRAVRTGVTEALARFLGAVNDPDALEESARGVYVALGRQEYRLGRTLDALQSAYRVGARVAWRRLARAADAAGVERAVTDLLAEAIFAYIDELSAESVEGYAQAQSERAGERERARSALLSELLDAQRPDQVDALAAAAGWRVPPRAAALACTVEALPGIARRLGPDVLSAVHERLGCVVIPDAEGPGRRAAIATALRSAAAALGPECALERLGLSWSLACSTFDAVEEEGLLAADEHLTELLVHEGGVVIERIAELRLGRLDALTPAGRERMWLTALAYVQQQGNAAAMARTLHVHPQTARYRIARLRELLGEQLEDPAVRFELEAALRAGVRGGVLSPS